MTPVYGLAEASVGLLFPPLGRGVLVDCIDRTIFTRQHKAQPAGAGDPHALRFIACGKPLYMPVAIAPGLMLFTVHRSPSSRVKASKAPLVPA